MTKKIVFALLALLLAGVLWHGMTPKHRGRNRINTQSTEGCSYNLETAQWIDCDCRSTLTDCDWFWTYCNIGGCLVQDDGCGSTGNLQCLGRCKDRWR